MRNLAHTDPALQSVTLELVTDSREYTSLEQQIERAYWELQAAQAHLQALLTLKQCEDWEAAQALNDLDPFSIH